MGSQPFSSVYPLQTLRTFSLTPGYDFPSLYTPNVLICIPLYYNLYTLELYMYPLELFGYPGWETLFYSNITYPFSLQGILETEVNVYTELLPELRLLKAPLPLTFDVLWGDCKTLNREILLLEEPVNQGFESALSLQKTGLDLGHVILVIFL